MSPVRARREYLRGNLYDGRSLRHAWPLLLGRHEGARLMRVDTNAAHEPHHATQHDRTGGKAMLKRVEDGPAVVACSTCRHSSKAKEDAAGVRGGARMVEALRAVKESDPRYAGIAVQEMSCLFACSDHCTAHLRAPDKIGYARKGVV